MEENLTHHCKCYKKKEPEKKWHIYGSRFQTIKFAVKEYLFFTQAPVHETRGGFEIYEELAYNWKNSTHTATKQRGRTRHSQLGSLHP